MRILHFLWGLGKGGAENLAVDLANHQSCDNEVVLLIGNDHVDPAVKALLDPSVRFVHVGRPAGSRNPYWIIKLLLAIYRLHPDVIHSHARDLASLARFIFKPMVLTVHDINQDLTNLAARYDRVCCISEAVFLDVRRRYPKLEPLRVDNGIVASKIAMAPRRRERTVMRGVQVSRLVHKKKGQDLLVSALSAINANRVSPALTIDFIGDGPSLEYLLQLADKLGVSGQCKFLGAMGREDVYASLCEYDVLIQPSRYEGFGLTVAEGMAAGIPVVVSDIEGPMEIIRHGLYGYPFKSDDAAALTTALEEVIADVATERLERQLADARRYVVGEYDLHRASDKYLEVYAEVVNER